MCFPTIIYVYSKPQSTDIIGDLFHLLLQKLKRMYSLREQFYFIRKQISQNTDLVKQAPSSYRYHFISIDSFSHFSFEPARDNVKKVFMSKTPRLIYQQVKSGSPLSKYGTYDVESIFTSPLKTNSPREIVLGNECEIFM